ncbi:MAG: hypothetical protein U5K43_11685 [Halofilum sp. (in: g-proteobacteria)]|nr:hypothetical protein [Halofilum sp. (in: g-proteobacteria)]
MDELELAVVLDRLHELVGDADRDVEVRQLAALVLGLDELADVRVVDAQHAHLGAAAVAGGLDGLAGAVEHAHERDRARGLGHDRLHERALGPDRAEVVADAAAGLERQHGLAQGLGDAVHGVRDRLHEAVDQRDLQAGARARLDAPAGDEAVRQRVLEVLLPLLLVLLLHRGERLGHARALGGAVLAVLGVLLFERVVGNGLEVHRCSPS